MPAVAPTRPAAAPGPAARLSNRSRGRPRRPGMGLGASACSSPSGSRVVQGVPQLRRRVASPHSGWRGSVCREASATPGGRRGGPRRTQCAPLAGGRQGGSMRVPATRALTVAAATAPGGAERNPHATPMPHTRLAPIARLCSTPASPDRDDRRRPCVHTCCLRSLSRAACHACLAGLNNQSRAGPCCVAVQAAG